MKEKYLTDKFAREEIYPLLLEKLPPEDIHITPCGSIIFDCGMDPYLEVGTSKVGFIIVVDRKVVGPLNSKEKFLENIKNFFKI